MLISYCYIKGNGGKVDRAADSLAYNLSVHKNSGKK